MTRVYYKVNMKCLHEILALGDQLLFVQDAVGAFLLFDVTRADSFHAVSKWKDDLDEKVLLPDGRKIPCVLVGNKSDQPKSGPVANEASMDAFVRQKEFCGWFPASARDNVNVEEAAQLLIQRILENEKWRQHHNGGKNK